jgi:hypothetical protein
VKSFDSMHLNSSPGENAGSSSMDTTVVDADVEDNADPDQTMSSPDFLTWLSEGINKMVSQCPVFDGTDYIYWHKKMEFLLRAIDQDLWDAVMKGSTELCKMASTEEIARYSQLDAKAKDIILSRLTEKLQISVSHLCNAKLIWDRLCVVYGGSSSHPAMDYRAALDYAKYEFYDDEDDPTICLMAKSGKVSAHKSHSSSEDDSDAVRRLSYSKLATLATKQQSALERIQKLLDRSDDLLHMEVKKNQSLIEDIKSLHDKYVEIQGRYESLSANHEKLSSDYLQRGQALEELRASHNDLRTKNDSLLAQQIIAS